MSFKPTTSQLINMAFGTKVIVYAPKSTEAKAAEVNYGAFATDAQREIERISAMGTPIIFAIKFLGDNYKAFARSGEIETRAMADFNLPASTITDFRRAKNITRSRISGGNGTIKQIYGMDDWIIRIRGVIIPDTAHEYPEPNELREQLLKWDDLAASINVEGALFNVHGISAITIRDISFSQIAGKPDWIPFTIDAVSDDPVEIDI